MLLLLLLGEPGLLLWWELLLGDEGGDTERVTGNKLLMLNFPSGEDWTEGSDGSEDRLVIGLEMGGNILEAEVGPADEVKLPLTSCSSDPRMDELPSESLASDLQPALLSLLPLAVEAVSVMVALRKRGLPTHCWMWGIKMSMGIFSSHRSHISLPVSIISLELTGLLLPATS